MLRVLTSLDASISIEIDGLVDLIVSPSNHGAERVTRGGGADLAADSQRLVQIVLVE